MGSYHQYISVLSQAVDDGDLSITIEADSPAVSLTSTVAVTTAQSEKTIAKNIAAALVTTLTDNDALFAGVPTFSTEDPVALFSVTRTDFCVCVWSQVPFTVTIDPAPKSAEIRVSGKATLLTLSEFSDYAAIGGLSLTVGDGSADLTTSQQAMLAEMASAWLISMTGGNPIVMSTQLFQKVTTLTNSVRLDFRPVVSHDAPRVKLPGYDIQAIEYLLYSKNSFRLNPKLGTLSFDVGGITRGYDPFAWGNELLVSYVAGYATIPTSLKQACVMLASIVSENPNVKSLKASDWAVEFMATGNPMLTRVKAMLGDFIL